jgi:signal transduction histidine kinase
MKENHQDIDEARQVYDLFWDSYQAGDLDTFASTLDENFEMIGTSESEICHSKEDGINFYKGQLKELIGKAEMRHRHINEISLDGLVLINETCDIYTLLDSEWAYYSKLRISSLMRKTGSEWKVAQQHCSLPDIRVQEGETLAIEKISRENLELRDAVKRRTAELENKNRELEIETSLERVRVRSMEMQKSSSLIDVVKQLGRELTKLGISVHYSQIFTDFSTDPKNGVNTWVDVHDKSYLKKFHIPFVDHPVTSRFYESFEQNMESFSETYSKSEKDRYFKFLFNHSDLKSIPEKRKQWILDAPGWVRFTVILKESCLHFGRYNLDEFTSKEKDIFNRFGKVFGQAYTRFLDLKKAEAQSRESEIQLALERVRAKGLAMHSPKDIEAAIAVVFNELTRLGIQMDRCGITLMNETPVAELWSTTLSQETKEVIDIVTGYLDFRIHPLTQQSYHDWKEKKKFSTYTLAGEELRNYYDKLEKQPEYQFPKADSYPDQQVLHSFFFNAGAIFVYTKTELSDEAKDIAHRFTNVFEQTYTRFLDILQAEKLVIETARQSSLDRIRAEIASMRSAEDLQQITPLMWDELNRLKIPFIRCGVFIIDEDNGLSHTYLSTSKGEPIAAMHLPLEDIPLVKKAAASWAQKKIYKEHWNEEDFRNWTQNLIDGGFITSKKKYEAGSAPKTLDLHFLPFKHGMLYIGNTEPLSQEELDLGQSMASAFSVAYDRYEDFIKLEQAKQKIEEAFQELETAKDQLVQQEKLASLGQLTAGIAHEIKNPLNFVNNFSELSVELIQEAREEVKRQTTNNKQETLRLLDILDDIQTNLKTIHRHGSRADSIVKSMLQHSRGGTGHSEPTDINSLIKEYANLAFHGMRAGKAPINVDIDLQLDESVGEVPLIAEDFSRVILNLVNNAFDAMREKSLNKDLQGFQTLGGLDSYQPKLTVRTHQKQNTVTIEIEDNGPGIPEEIKDKILQPFFTTKKGTAGTGLGLSITNDIIKAHGGSLDIKSSTNKGTTFSILLT